MHDLERLQPFGAGGGADLQLVKLVCPPDASKAHLEAITSHPMFCPSLTQHAGQPRLLLTLSHADKDRVKLMIASIRKGIYYVLANAHQLQKVEHLRASYITSLARSSKPDRKTRCLSACVRLAWLMGCG